MNNQWVVGVQAIRMLLTKNPAMIMALYVAGNTKKDPFKSLVKLAKDNEINVKPLSVKEIEAVAFGANHQNIAAQCHDTQLLSERDLENSFAVQESSKESLYLVLDGVQDPHNLGACLRSADAAGVAGVIFPKDKACGITPVVQKVACGAVLNLKLYQVKNLVRAITILKDNNVWVFGTSDKAEQSLYETDLTGNVAIVMGQEGEGLRSLTEKTCDYLVSLPMYGLVESLNVSVATGICLYEALRQRG